MTSPAQQAPPSRILSGIDVSHHQGQIDWAAVAGAGVSWAAIKVTEGADWTDPRGAENLAGARAQGIEVAAYHFLGLDSEPIRQAAHFLETVGGDPAALRPRGIALDLEDPPGRTWGQDAGPKALEWLRAVETITSITPRVYLSPAFAQRVRLAHLAPELGAFPLWVAHWDTDAPTVPAPWSDWAAWQWDPHGRCPGIAGDVDLNHVRS